MGFSLDIEDLRICLNEVDEVGNFFKRHPRTFFVRFIFYKIIDNCCLGRRRKVELPGIF